MPSRISPDRTISSACDKGVSWHSMRFVLFGLRLAGRQPSSEVNRHGLVQKARAGIEEQSLRPLGRAISGLLQQLSLGPGQGLFPGIDATCGKFPQVSVRRITILALQQNARLGRLSSTARITAEPECRTTSRRATIPFGSRTRSELTLKAGPLNTIFDERTSALFARREGFFELRAGCFPTRAFLMA